MPLHARYDVRPKKGRPVGADYVPYVSQAMGGGLWRDSVGAAASIGMDGGGFGWEAALSRRSSHATGGGASIVNLGSVDSMQNDMVSITSERTPGAVARRMRAMDAHGRIPFPPIRVHRDNLSEAGAESVRSMSPISSMSQPLRSKPIPDADRGMTSTRCSSLSPVGRRQSEAGPPAMKYNPLARNSPMSLSSQPDSLANSGVELP